jgi:hypothetical protein
MHFSDFTGTKGMSQGFSSFQEYRFDFATLRIEEEVVEEVLPSRMPLDPFL